MSDELVGGVGSREPVKGNYGISLSSNSYNPKAVQEEIDAMLRTIKKGHPLSTAQINYIMTLAGRYKSDVLGNDAAILAQLNKYLGTITDLGTQLGDAANFSTSGLTGNQLSANPSEIFYNDVVKLQEALNTPFFQTGAGSSLRSQIGEALNNVLNAAFPGPSGGFAFTPAGLQELWLKTSGSSGVSGDANPMQLLQQYLGSVSQIYTGVSKSTGATVQSDSSQLTGVENSINTMQKTIFQLMALMIQAFKTG
jgi:hypothetical protein